MLVLAEPKELGTILKSVFEVPCMACTMQCPAGS